MEMGFVNQLGLISIFYMYVKDNVGFATLMCILGYKIAGLINFK